MNEKFTIDQMKKRNQQNNTDNQQEDLQKRVEKLEEFINQIRGG